MGLNDRYFNRIVAFEKLPTALALVAAGLIVVGLISSLLVPRTVEAVAGTNQQLNFQGRLLTSSGTVVPDGNYNMRFKIYCDGDGALPTGSDPGSCSNHATDEHLLWTETRQNSAGQGVVVRNGYFAVALGSITAFGSSVDWNQSELWMSMDVTTNGTDTGGSPTWNGEMTPFKRMGSAVYAFNAMQLGGMTASQFAQLAANQTFTGTNTFQPTTNISSVAIKQNSSGSFGQDVFTVQGSSSGNFIQVTSTAANQGAVTIQSLGSNALTLQSGSGTVTLGSSTILTASGALTVQSTGANAMAVDTGGAATLSLGTGNANAVSVSKSGVTTTVNGALTVSEALTANGSVDFADAAAGDTIDIGDSLVATQDTVNIQGDINIGTDSDADTITIGDSGNADTFSISSTGFKVTTGGAVSGVSTIATSSTINSQTISSSANFTGTLTVQGASSLTLGTASGNTGSATFRNSSNGNAFIIQPSTSTPVAQTWVLPAALPSAGDCLSAASVSAPTVTLGYTTCGGAGGANQQLSNLSGTVAVNLNLSPGGTTNTLDVGTSSQSWRTGYFATSVVTPLVDLAGTLNLGTSSATDVNIGNTTAGTEVVIQGGTGTGASAAIRLSPANAGDINIGTTTQTGQITVGQSTGTNTISIGSANGSSSTQTVTIGGGTSTTSGGKIVNIATGVPGNSTTNTIAIGSGGSNTGTVGVTIGSNGAAAHTTLIQGGTGATAIQLNTAASGTISIGNTANTKTVNIGSVGSTAGDSTIAIGTSSSNIQGVTIGSTSSTSTTTIQAGTGTATGDINIGDQTTASKIIHIGSVDNAGTGTVRIATGAAAQTVTIGSTNTTSVLTLQGGTGANAVTVTGMTLLQPTANLTNGQIGVTQTATFANATSSGIVRGLQQNITVSNTVAGTNKGVELTVTDATTLTNTNEGLEINVTDNSASGAKTNTGLKVTMSGSSTNQTQYGLEVTATAGVGIKALSSGVGSSVACANVSGSLSIGICGDSTGTSGVGVYGRSTGAGSLSSLAGAGVAGINTRALSGAEVSIGVYGVAGTNASTTGTGYSVLGVSRGGAGETSYAGYFTTDTGAVATAGAVLAAAGVQPASVVTNGTAALRVLDVSGGIGGNTTGTTGQTAGGGATVSIATGTGGAASGASGANIGGAGGTFTLQGGTGGAAASTTAASTGGAGGSLSLTSGTGGAQTGASGSTVGGAAGTITIQGGNGGAVTSGTGTGGAGGSITIQAGNAGSGGNANAGTITLATGTASGSGTAGIISIGNTANTKTINLGSVGTTAGSSTIAIGTSSSNIQGITIGSTSSTSTTTIQAGTGTAAGDINIGDQTTAGKIIHIGSVDNAGTGTVAIATAAAVQGVTIGSTNGASTTLIQGGTGTAGITLRADGNFEFDRANGTTGMVFEPTNGRLGIGDFTGQTPPYALSFISSSSPTIGVQDNASGAGGSLTVRSGDGSGANAAGNLTLSAGGSASGTNGVTIVKNDADSTTALQVQKAASTNRVLTVDTSNNEVELGTVGTGGINGKLVLNTTNASNYTSSLAVSASQAASWDYTLPIQSSITNGHCMQASGVSGAAVQLIFASCGGGGTDLQGAYTASTPSSGIVEVTATDNKSIRWNMADTTTDSSFIVNLQCTTCSSNAGRFAVQQGGTEVFMVQPNTGSNTSVIIRQNASSTANLLQIQTSAPATLLQVASTGATSITTVSSATTLTALAVTAGSSSSIATAGSTGITSAGGAGASSVSASTGGAGGVGLSVTSGNGGANLSTGAGGAGGANSITSGNGGNGSGGGGDGGAITLQGGTGGNSGSSNGGAGGSITLQGGNAGTGGNANAGGVTIDTGTFTGTGTAIIALGDTNAKQVDIGNTTNFTALNVTGPVGADFGGLYMYSGTTIDSTHISHAIQKKADNLNVLFYGTDGTPWNYLETDWTNKILKIVPDTTTGQVQIGGGFSTSNTQQTPIVLDSDADFADGGTCSNTAGGGSVYYNSSTNTLRACIRDGINSAGSWEDLPSTAGLGALIFGVVPDSGLTANQGDWAALGGATVGPCKVSWATSTSVSVAPCVAYSGGRKVVVGSATSITGLNGNTQWYHICFNSSGALAATTGNASETANMPTFSINNPLLCIADVKTGGSSTITQVYDYRTFTVTQKVFVTNQTTAAGLGQVVSVATSSPVANGVTQVPATLNTAKVRGVVVATTGTTSTTALNAIIAVRGPQWVKHINTAGTLNNYLQPVTTSGIAGYMGDSGTISTGAYGALGLQLRLSDNATCNATTNCQMSVPTEINIR